VADPVAEAAARLYGLPLEAFTRERDATARELRKAKERDAAAAVAKLQKPTQASWAANHLARERSDLVGDLLEAGDALREAQDAAMAGEGSGDLRRATAEERRAVEALVAAAKDLKPGGRKPTETTLERLRTTLHAAATDDDVRAALEAGRLVEDAEGSAFGLMALGAGGGDEPRTARKPKPKSRPKRTAAERKESERDAAEREAAEREARERRQRLEAELREARSESRSLERDLARAEREAQRAARRLEDAEAALEDARGQAEEAKEELEAARDAATAARDHIARLEEQLD
jgi:hypothetical protein